MPAVQPPREVTEIPHRLWAAGRTIRPATGVNTIEFTRFDGAPIMASDVLNENYDGLLCSNEEMLFRGPSIYLRFEVTSFFIITVVLVLISMKVAWIRILVPGGKKSFGKSDDGEI